MSALRITAIVAGTVAVLVLLVIFAGTALAHIGGGSTVRVQSGSMGSAYRVGSLAFTKSVPREVVRRGDVILVSRGNAIAILHRVVELQNHSSNITVRTKGDANATADPGVVVLTLTVIVANRVVPNVGYLLATLSTRLGWVLLLVVPTALLTVSALRRIWWPKEQVAWVQSSWLHRVTLALLLTNALLAVAYGGRAMALSTDTEPVQANQFTIAPVFP